MLLTFSIKLARFVEENRQRCQRFGLDSCLICSYKQMLALVVWSRVKSGSHSDPAAESKMAERKCVLSKELRKSHLAVEVSLWKTGDPASNDALEKCKDTWKEADKLLKTVIENKAKGKTRLRRKIQKQLEHRIINKMLE